MHMHYKRLCLNNNNKRKKKAASTQIVIGTFQKCALTDIQEKFSFLQSEENNKERR